MFFNVLTKKIENSIVFVIKQARLLFSSFSIKITVSRQSHTPGDFIIIIIIIIILMLNNIFWNIILMVHDHYWWWWMMMMMINEWWWIFLTKTAFINYIIALPFSDNNIEIKIEVMKWWLCFSSVSLYEYNSNSENKLR